MNKKFVKKKKVKESMNIVLLFSENGNCNGCTNTSSCKNNKGCINTGNCKC